MRWYHSTTGISRRSILAYYTYLYTRVRSYPNMPCCASHVFVMYCVHTLAWKGVPVICIPIYAHTYSWRSNTTNLSVSVVVCFVCVWLICTVFWKGVHVLLVLFITCQINTYSLKVYSSKAYTFVKRF